MHSGAAVERVDEEGEAEFLAVGLGSFFKSRPVEEGGQRFIFCEAANEAWDQQRERIMKAALLGSRDLFLRHGNLDLDHLTMVGHKLGIENPHIYELGQPVEVREGDFGVFVKGRIYEKGPNKDIADYFWKSLTESEPPMRWQTSVGGTPVERRTVLDPHSAKPRRIITKAKWVNLAFSKQPVNLSMPSGVSVQPIGAFVKSVLFGLGETCCDDESCGGDGSCDVLKTITAGYGTDAAALTGGAALRRQSLAGSVADPFDALAARLIRRQVTCPHTTGQVPITTAALREHFRECEHLDAGEAARAAARLRSIIAARRSARAS